MLYVQRLLSRLRRRAHRAKSCRACGQPHQTISVGDEFLKQFPRLAEQTVRITDGAMDVSGAAEFMSIVWRDKSRRCGLPAITGRKFCAGMLHSNHAVLRKCFPRILFRSFLPPRRLIPKKRGNPLSFIAFKQVPWHHYSRLAVEQSQITVRSPFLDNDLVALAFQAPPEAVTSLAPSLR